MSCQEKIFLVTDSDLLHDASIVGASPQQEHMSVRSFLLFWGINGGYGTNVKLSPPGTTQKNV
jgi:hypothetical protein